jgi:hypothetical protein
MPHRALRDFDRLRITRLPHPLYSQDLALCHFWLFETLKRKLEGCTFENPIEMMMTVNPFSARFLLMHLFQCLTNGNADCANASIEAANISKLTNSHRSVLLARENFIARTDLLHRLYMIKGVVFLILLVQIVADIPGIDEF